jgi:hypothetical protein
VQTIESPLEALRPLEVLLIEARTKEANGGTLGVSRLLMTLMRLL